MENTHINTQESPSYLMIGNKRYRLAKITFASIVGMSEAISKIPEAIAKSKDDVVATTFRHALSYRKAACVIAVAMTSTRFMLSNPLFHWLFSLKVNHRAKLLSSCHSSGELNDAAQRLVQGISPEIAAFYSLTSYFAGINILKPTESEETTISEE